jgi:G3E family GTPase
MKEEEKKEKSTKLVILGGFLGSGKTTLMVALGKRLIEKGKTVALITNDQGEFLVDTKFAESEGFATSEVLDGCFCCRFPDFMESIATSIAKAKPDYILAEPVGSCTDLLATVVAPLQEYHKDMVSLAPLCVLVDGTRIVGEYAEMNLTDPKDPKEVLVSHQIKEAHALLLSKMDSVDKEKLAERMERVKQLNPNAEIIECSANSLEGLERIEKLILDAEAGVKSPIPIDYDIYAKAEAEYGWYNGRWKVCSGKGFDAMEMANKLIKSFSEKSFQGEVAHAKLFVVSETCSFKLSFVMGKIQSDGMCNIMSKATDTIVTFNVRARTSPEAISSHIKETLRRISKELGVEVEDYKYTAIVPSPPKPHHRIGIEV